jgi:hypothetical protein
MRRNTLNLTSNSITFTYNVTDNTGIENCSLLINKKINKTNSSITKIDNKFQAYLKNNNYNWSIECYDASIFKNKVSSQEYNLSVLYEIVRWKNITFPEGVFEPKNNSLAGTHFSTFNISFEELEIRPDETLECIIKVANNSLIVLNKTEILLNKQNYTLNYTVKHSDSIINDADKGYLPWILKNCSIKDNNIMIINKTFLYRIYTHDDKYWEDDEVTRAVACAGTPGVYFDNIAKCEFTEDTLFALQMRNGNPINPDCFNNKGIACDDDYCKGLYFPSCDALDYFGGYSPAVDDPNGYATFNVDFSSYSVPIAYTRYVNASGQVKIRLNQALTAKTFSITLYNLTNVSSANVC